MGTKAAVLTSGPIGFTDSSGKQLSIPGSAVHFDDTGAVKADQWPLYGANKAIIDAWLPYLAKGGVILPAPTAPSAPAMVIKAKAPGSSGNFIQIGFSNIRPGSSLSGVDIFDVTVTETNTYRLLTPSTIKEILGTAPRTGKQPGLVYVSSAGDPKLPKADEYTLSGDPATKDIDKNADAGTGVAFTVSAKSSGADGALTKVTIKDVDANANTFTLVTTWTKTATGIQVTAVQTSFDYELTVSPPEGSTTLAVPAPGTITLSGGADTTSAVPASVTVAANS